LLRWIAQAVAVTDPQKFSYQKDLAGAYMRLAALYQKFLFKRFPHEKSRSITKWRLKSRIAGRQTRWKPRNGGYGRSRDRSKRLLGKNKKYPCRATIELDEHN
jgi:hypothetical protein